MTAVSVPTTGTCLPKVSLHLLNYTIIPVSYIVSFMVHHTIILSLTITTYTDFYLFEPPLSSLVR